MKDFKWTINLRKSLVAGLTSYLLATMLSIPLHNSIVIGLIGLLSGSVFDVFTFLKKIKAKGDNE